MSKARIIAWLSAAGFATTGLWAFAAPSSFYSFATYPPYNEHFIHDIGAFQIGLAAVLALAALGWGALAATLGGAAAGQVVHAIAHLMDRDIGGGSWRDFVLTAAFAAVLAYGSFIARKERT